MAAQTSYYVAEQHGEQAPRVRDWAQFPNAKSAQMEADKFNADEAERAEHEFRSTKTRYFVVQATTTFQELDA